MRSFYLLTALLVLGVGILPARAVDLTKIDRTIAKEPAYSSKAPRYCLLIVGPEARTRVWLVLDDDTLYVDRNGNGDLTDRDERVESEQGARQFIVGDILDADGKTKHTSFMVAQKRDSIIVAGLVGGKLTFMAGTNSPATLQFGDRPQNAPVIHFGGALTMGLTSKTSEKVELVGGEELLAWVGTPGLGKGTFAGLIHQGIPGDLHPVADIEFPNRTAGGKPVQLRVVLKQRC